MSYCTNCNTRITCGCQRATATDGTKVCTNCVAPYNAKIQKKGASAPGSKAPSGVNAKYSGPGKQV